MARQTSEWYVIRLEPPVGGPRWERERYLTPRGEAGPVSRARRFRTLEAAEGRARELDAAGTYRCSLQFCSRGPRPDPARALSDLTARVMEIPQPYRRTAYNWLRGRDVRGLLTAQSDEVWERHRRVLAEHGIDLDRPSAVVLLRPRRRPVVINTGQTPPDGGPRRYFLPRGERPEGTEGE